MCNTVSILVPFLTLNLCDSVFRFVMDKNADEGSIVSYSVQVYLKGFLVLLVLCLLNVFLECLKTMFHILYSFLDYI